MQKRNYDLDEALLTFGGGKTGSSWTTRDACTGNVVLGSTGSGKSSAIGRLLAHKFLKAGWGGLILCVKRDEAALWENYCRETNRSADLIIVNPKSKWAFDFMQYESTAKEVTYTQNLVHILSTVIKAGKEQENKNNSDEFWADAMNLTLSSAIDLCLLAYGEVSIQRIHDIFLSAPKKEENSKEGADHATAELSPFKQAYNMARINVKRKVALWESTFDKTQLDQWREDQTLDFRRSEAVPDYRLLGSVYAYFMQRYKSLADKTRSIVDFVLLTFLHRLLQEPIFSLFCSKPSNFTPEDSLKGKIIVLDLPIKTYDKAGRDAQILFKYIWQRAIERRDINVNERPVFLWADEGHFLIHPEDTLFQTTARASRVASVYLTQNVNNFLSTMGGSKAEAYVNSFLGTLGNKFFLANTDIRTNQYASDLIGSEWIEDYSQTKGLSNDINISNTKSIKLEKIVRPEEFVKLLTGGPKNNYNVGFYFHKQGDPFPDGKNHKKIMVNQQAIL